MKPEEFEEIREQEEMGDKDEGLSLEELGSSWIKAPVVGGDPIEFTVQKIVKLEGKDLIGKTKDGKTFDKNLSKVDFGYEITTTDGSKYTISAWEVFGKLKSIFQKLKAIKGTKVRITHILDGMQKENKDKDCYKVEAFVNGKYATLDRETREWGF